MNLKANFKAYLIIAALFAISGLAYFIINSESYFHIPKREALGHVFIGLLISLVSGWFAVVIWNVVINIEKENDANLLINKIHKQFEGLKEIDLVEAYEKAGDYISNCSVVRIIGVPDTSKEIVNNYLSRTLNIMTAKKDIKYRRICPAKMSNLFQEHLTDILKTNIGNEDLDAEIMLLDDFVPAYTYLIIDSKFLLLTLCVDGTNESFRFYTEVNGIIKSFQDHFDDVWRKEKSLNNKSINSEINFKDYILKRNELNNYIDEMRNSINRLDLSQKNMEAYTFDVLNRVTERITNISNNELILDHAVKKWNLLNTFSFFMSKLDKNSIYSTISFPEFWEDIEREEKDTSNTVQFLERNKMSLQKEAKINRLLILPKYFWTYVDNDQKSNTESEITWNWKNVSEIIQQHMELLKVYNKFYDLKILIVPFKDYKFDRDHFLNFAIIKYSEEEKIMFTPRRAHNQTEIKRLYKGLYEGSGNVQTFIENEEKIIQKVNQHSEQILEQEEWEELKKIKPDFFRPENEDKIEVLLGIKYRQLLVKW